MRARSNNDIVQLWIAVFLLLTFSLSAQSSQAQTPLKIGYVNAAKILDQSPLAERARSRLEQEFAPRDASLVSARQALRTLEDQLALDGTTMGDSERRSLERDIRNQRRDLKRAQEEFREDFNIRRNEELSKLQRVVYEAIVNLAKEEGFDLIVNDSAAIFAGPKIDLTDTVMGRLE